MPDETVVEANITAETAPEASEPTPPEADVKPELNGHGNEAAPSVVAAEAPPPAVAPKLNGHGNHTDSIVTTVKPMPVSTEAEPDPISEAVEPVPESTGAVGQDTLAPEHAAQVEVPAATVVETLSVDANTKPAASKPATITKSTTNNVAAPTAPVIPLVTSESQVTEVKPLPKAAPQRPAVAAPAPNVQIINVAPPKPTAEPRSISIPRWLKVAALTLATIVIVTNGVIYGAYRSWYSSGLIASGLIVEQEPISGLTRKQAQQRLFQRYGALSLAIDTPERQFTASLADLGGKPQIERVIDNAYWYGRSGNQFTNMWKLMVLRQEEHRIDLPMRWDKDQLKRKISEFAETYYQKPRDASLKVSEEGVQIVSDQEGRKLNAGATIHRIQHKYKINTQLLTASVEHVTPRIRSADLVGTDVELGSYPTWFNSGLRGRTRNIRVAAAAINGKVILPGESFSFNSQTGERTWEKGYRMAHIFERKPGKTESEIVDGLAGGVCQVSSTLYNAVRRSNENAGKRLKILERNSHSLPVTYVPRGLDATVAWPSLDFRFRNQFPYPVYLRAAVRGSRLRISVWARVPENAEQILPPELTTSASSVIEENADAQSG